MSHHTQLEPALRAVEPALRLVHERHLRQILNFLIDRGRSLPTNPELPYWFTRADLAAAAVLPRETLRGDEPRLLLVTDPDRMILDRPEPEQLRAYWRVLFRAAVMGAIDAKLATGALTAEQCRERLHRFGPAAAREIRFVLETEHLAALGASDADVYRTFAAVYLDLDHFTGHGAEEFFPALPHGHAVRDALAENVAVAALVAAARPAGAADPVHEPAPDERFTAPPTAPAPALAPAPGGASKLLQKAADAEQKGNVVRAAILYTQAAEASAESERKRATAAARAALRVLVDRLGDVLEWDADTREEWHQALAALLPRAAVGIWPRAARCLYELQRIPADFAREVYAVDLPEYIRTFGGRPVRRHLPHARPVLVLMAFRKAHKQLLRSAMSEPEQLRIDRLMHHEMHRREHAIRHAFAPIIVSALTAAGLVASNRVEEVAREKVVAELLDRVCERGYLRIGDLRDAVARNQLKLSDLTKAGEFFGGDALLRADTGLAYALDGVYRRGEFYLRWIQRFVSVFFGTPWGRALTLYLALPFGGAFLTLMFAEELRHIGGKVAALVARPAAKQVTSPVQPAKVPGSIPQAPAAQQAGTWDFDDETLEFYWDDTPNTEFDPETQEFVHPVETEQGRDAIASEVEGIFRSSASQHKTEEEAAHHASFLIRWPTILGFGVFLLLVFHVPPFRRAVFLALGYVWWAVRGVLWDIPTGLWRCRAVREVRHSGTVRFLHRHIATPLLLSLLILGILFIARFNPIWLLLWGWTVFVALLIAYNTPWGWLVQDRIAEALSDWWRRVRVNFLPGLLAAIVDTFRMLANWIERQLYAVDEWMRFRGGDSQGSLWVKALLGLIWFPIAYVTRFVFYLLIEPQVNPVKHFPVVTVSHKVIWPMVPQLAKMTGLTPWTVGMIVNGVPGIFGFIAWELKENWRLYAANRAKGLPRVMVGSHGESMRGLLRPGFHSGTVPKLHRKTRKALAAGDRAKVSVMHHELEHTAEGVHRFVERDLLPLLAGCPDWGGVAVEVHAIHFGVQRAEIELTAPALGTAPFVLALENVGGQIEGSVAATGWADQLTDAQRAVFVFALRGMMDMAAATRYDGRARSEDAEPAPGYGALARRVTLEEWVQFWEAKSTAR